MNKKYQFEQSPYENYNVPSKEHTTPTPNRQGNFPQRKKSTGSVQVSQNTFAQHQFGSQSNPQTQRQQTGFEGFPKLDDPTTQLGMQLGAQALNAGQTYVNQNFSRFFDWHSLKYYFHVNTSYVLHKILLLCFPFRHGSWQRLVLRSDVDGTFQGFRAPDEDVNAPDMYIPVMALITFVLLTGFSMGVNNTFAPDQLGSILSSTLIASFLELLIIGFGSYILSVGGESSFLDIIAHTGYKFVPVVFVIIGRFFLPSTVTIALFAYLALALFFFLLRSLRHFMIPESTQFSDGRRTRVHFLFIIAMIEIFVMYFLVYWISAAPNK